jgi:hypothetical protein
VESGVQELRDMDHIHDAMQINNFLNQVEKNMEDDDNDILANIVHAQSVGEIQGDKIDEGC